MQNMLIRWRMMLMVVIGVVGVIGLSMWGLAQQRALMLEDRQVKTRHIVEMAHSIIDHYAKLAADGTLSQEAAQKEAMDTLRDARYDTNEYFWINDFNSVVIMHPIKPALDGKDLSKLEDKSGKLIFPEFVKVVKADGAGFVDYLWPKPGFEEPVPKISYVMGHKEWGWIVGSGIYVDDVDAIFTEKLIFNGLMTLVVVLLLIALSVTIARSIAGPLAKITGNMQRLAEGERDVGIHFADQKSEIGDLARTMEVFKARASEMDELREKQSEAERATAEQRQQDMLALADSFDQKVGAAITTVAGSAGELQHSAQSMTASAGQANQVSQTVSTASQEASSNVQSMASATEQLSASVSEISAQVAQSSKVTAEAVSEAKQVNQRVQGLSEAAQKVGEVVDMITSIAEQTNLLALNATIEAARAGEAGKGFAVVANEVKSLASQTSRATEEIGDQIGQIQEATNQAVDAIAGITKTINSVDEIATVIAAAVEQQGAATQEIARNAERAAAGTAEVQTNVVGMTRAADETGEASSKVLSAANELSSQSEVLRKEVQDFLSQIRSA